jgi:hypothetical protein
VEGGTDAKLTHSAIAGTYFCVGDPIGFIEWSPRGR